MDQQPQPIRDLPTWLWLGIPLAYFFGRYLWFYLAHVGILPNGEGFFQGETGFVESLTVLALLIGCGYTLAILIRYWPKQSIRMRGLLICYALGCFFIAGEETSWGQHYFKWSTPEHFNNVQNETNIHNSELMMKYFNRLRLLMGHLITLFGAVIPIAFLIKKKRFIPEQNAWWWFWASYICIPVAILTLIANIPNDINRWFDTGIPIPNGRGEFKESFIALFLMLYSISLYTRITRLEQDERSWQS